MLAKPDGLDCRDALLNTWCYCKHSLIKTAFTDRRIGRLGTIHEMPERNII